MVRELKNRKAMYFKNEITEQQTVVKEEVIEEDCLEIKEENVNETEDENDLNDSSFKESNEELITRIFEGVVVPTEIKKEQEDYSTAMETVNFKEELSKDPLELKEEIKTCETHVSNLKEKRPIDNGNSNKDEIGKCRILPDLFLKKQKCFECNFCKKLYITKQVLRMHKQTHQNGRKLFTFKRSLQFHRPTHENKRIECNICKKLFLHKNTLRMHKRTHENKRFECNVCEKSYKYKYGLQAHKKTHEREERFECDICEKSFVYKQSLLEHKKTHEKRFECDICEKSFAYKRSIQRHKRTHKNIRFECDVCKKSYLSIKHLKVHKQTHENKRFECDICEKSFTQRTILQMHKIMHRILEPVSINKRSPM